MTSTVQQGLRHNDVTVQRAGAQGLGHSDVYSTTRGWGTMMSTVQQGMGHSDVYSTTRAGAQ